MGGPSENCSQTRQIARGAFFKAEVSGTFGSFLLNLDFQDETRGGKHARFCCFWAGPLFFVCVNMIVEVSRRSFLTLQVVSAIVHSVLIAVGRVKINLAPFL